MTTAITRIGELIQKFAGNPAQSKSSVQATIVYEILYLLEQENFFPRIYSNNYGSNALTVLQTQRPPEYCLMRSI